MAVSELPTDANIDDFLGIVGHLERSRAIRILQFNNNDVTSAVNDYFDDTESNKHDRPTLSSQRWDETAFNSNRDGSSNQTGISFTIEGSDEYPSNFGTRYDGAPSRPPSRTSNNKSPHTGVINLSASHAAADPRTSMTAFEPNDDDPELKEALLASLRPQESGVTSTNTPAFGPATRSQYESGKWDLVPTTTLREIMSDPEPEDRKRDLGVPAFLKPSLEDHRIGALLTIYHEIPMIRELFLDRANTIANYGNDREWWTGKTMEGLSMTVTEEVEHADFRHELQRLMAFLDKTDRSYGSAEALVNLPLVQRLLRNSDKNTDSAVVEAFKEVCQNNQSKIKKLFSRGVDGPAEIIQKEFAILELSLPSDDSPAETIYDIADAAMWESSGYDLNSTPFLTNIGEVIAFRLNAWATAKKRISVPAVWYPDRYLETGRQAALDMRLSKLEIFNVLERIDRLQTGLTNVTLRDDRQIKVKELIQAALQHDREQLEEDSSTASDDMEESLMILDRVNKTKGLSAELLKLMESIDRKLIGLNEEREKAIDSLRELSKLYTHPSELPNQPPLHKYTLRGVSPSKNTVYICRTAVPELIDIDLESEGSQPKGDQWWKIHYEPSESKPVNIEKTTEDKVLEAASESSNSLLVYASEKAMNWIPQSLPHPLETFVRKDNIWFKNELPPNPDSPVSSPKSPTSPGKRKVESTESSDEALQDFRYKGSSKSLEKEEGDADLEVGKHDPSHLAQPTVNGNRGLEMIEGVDPDLIEAPPIGQEMQERNSMRMLLTQNGTEKTKPIDLMDMDQVMEDENVAQESGAVKRVGFVE